MINRIVGSFLFAVLIIGCSDNAPTPTIVKREKKVVKRAEGSSPAGHGMMPTGGSSGGHPKINTTTAKISAPAVNSIKAATDGNIASLYKKRVKLSNKTIIVRGKVMKFSPRIMGKNWVHLQDGSGDSKNGTNDLTITTQEVVQAGEIATFKGVLKIDKKLGMGNLYPVILQKAVLFK